MKFKDPFNCPSFFAIENAESATCRDAARLLKLGPDLAWGTFSSNPLDLNPRHRAVLTTACSSLFIAQTSCAQKLPYCRPPAIFMTQRQGLPASVSSISSNAPSANWFATSPALRPDPPTLSSF